MSVDYNARMQRLLDSVDADAVAFVPGSNMVYFTGLQYFLSERPIVAFLTRQGLSFIMPQLEMIKLTKRTDLEAQAFIWTDTFGYESAFKEAMQAMKGKRIAVDGQTMRVFEWLAMGDAGLNLGETLDAGHDMLQIRAIKTADEVAAMRKAIDISEKALDKVLGWVKPGMTELQIAGKLSDEMTAGGCDSILFNLILTGPNSALPHGNTGSRILGKDDFLLMDFGCVWNNYPSDITRTYCLGTPSDEMKRIYEAVYQANAAARAISAPGVTCGAVDKAARDVIEAAGYGEFFTHRTGHGLGLSGHEMPQIASGVETILEPGMVFTIEPGIYIPAIGGVRIEDDMVVTETGCESMTTYPREFRTFA
jgi:Xaa-Pro dipeptidase